jgi:hypothetical protein
MSVLSNIQLQHRNSLQALVLRLVGKLCRIFSCNALNPWYSWGCVHLVICAD